MANTVALEGFLSLDQIRFSDPPPQALRINGMVARQAVRCRRLGAILAPPPVHARASPS